MNSFVQVAHVFVDAPAHTNLLKLVNGKKPTAVSILRDINLMINAGSWLTVFGRAGAGKTTLLKLLAGAISPTKGTVAVNGHEVKASQHTAIGYVSDTTESSSDIVRDVLQTVTTQQTSASIAARIQDVAKKIGLDALLGRPVATLSKSQQILFKITRAILSEAPLILLDDVADELGTAEIQRILGECCQGRTVLLTTRFTATAEGLELPIVLLHDGTLAHLGTCEEIANTVACPRVLDAWIENLRYDMLKKIRNHAGVTEVRLLPTSQFAGQRVRISLVSSRYLPAIYDIISQTPLIRVNEVPPSLQDVLAKL